MIKNKSVLEIDDRGGLFTIGPVKDTYEALEMFLNWYHFECKDQKGRDYIGEWWGIEESSINIFKIEETVMHYCNECDMWSIGEDSDCYNGCDKKLDGRTKRKTFVIYFY